MKTKPERFHLSKTQHRRLRQILIQHDAAHQSIRRWLRSVDDISQDQQTAVLDTLECSIKMKRILVGQLAERHFGRPLDVEAILSKAESAMLRACALEQRLRGEQ